MSKWKTEYRVGVLHQMVSGRMEVPHGALGLYGKGVYGVWAWLKAESDPLDLETFENNRADADTFQPKVAMTWVQVLAARHQCIVVERVEVSHA